MPPNKKRGSRDLNHDRIVWVAKAAGASVLELHEIGSSAPDILVGWEGRNILVEIKNKDARGALRPGQVDWHDAWAGHNPDIAWDQYEMLAILGIFDKSLADQIIAHANKTKGRSIWRPSIPISPV